MTEYIPCFLKRQIDPTKRSFIVNSIGEGCAHLQPIDSYIEELIPVEMSELVALKQNKRTLLPGPFRRAQIPDWANRWFKKEAGKNV